MLPCQENSRSFFRILQSADGLDLRDNRGKRHDLAVVLVGVMLAILSNRDGSLSSVQRHMKNHYEKLVTVLGVEQQRPVSRSQLPLILEKVSFEVFDRLIFESFGIKLNSSERQWFAVDGKELRGSIGRGSKRGEAVVQAVAHSNCQTVAQDYYSGEKESEVPIVRKILEQGELSSQKISLDALHCKALTLSIISESGGKYVVGLKDNQKELKKQIIREMKNQAILFNLKTLEKSHGRIESRGYEFFDVLELETDERWKSCQIRTVIKVTRESEELKSGKSRSQESYYLTNEVGALRRISPSNQTALASGNQQSSAGCELKRRRTAFKKKCLQRTMAGIRTLAMTILEKTRCQNKKAQLEEFADDFDNLIITLKVMNFL